VRLSDYIQYTRDLLNDSAGLYVPLPQLIRYINRARYRVALHTGCIRKLISGNAPFGNSAQAGSFIPGAAQAGSSPVTSFQTIAGVEKYSYAFANAYLRQSNAGVKGIIDVNQVAVSWGGIRPAMTYLPWDDLQALARSYNQGVFSYPYWWSTMGDGEVGEVWLFPVPSVGPDAQGNGEMEWLVTCVPLPIYTDNDAEAIPEPFQSDVPYHAAHTALLGKQRFGAAQIFQNEFNERLNIDRVASDNGKVSSYYTSDL